MTKSQLQLRPLKSLEEALCSQQWKRYCTLRKAFIYHKYDTGYPAGQLSKGERDRTNCAEVSRERGSPLFQGISVAHWAETTKWLSLNASKAEVGPVRRRIQGALISWLYNGCALILKKALVNYERHLSDIRKIPGLGKIYHHLSEA